MKERVGILLVDDDVVDVMTRRFSRQVSQKVTNP